VGTSYNPKIVTDGLVLCLDAANSKSIGTNRNVLNSPEDFSTASWSRTNVVVTKDAVLAPDGTLTGNKLAVSGAAGAFKVITQETVSNRTISVSVKKGEYIYASIGKTNGAGYWTSVNFNLETGLYLNTSSASISELPVSYGIKPEKDGWYRIWAMFDTVQYGTSFFIAGTSDGEPIFGATRSNAGDGTSGIYIWGAQVSEGKVLFDYVPASRGLVKGTIYDLSGNGNTGALTNGPVFSSANGGSIVFDGVNDRISTNFKPSGARSYFIWVKYNIINSLPGGYSLTGTQEVNAYNYLGIQNGGYFYYYAGTSGGQLTSVLLSANTWYQQGFVLFSDGSRKLYLNGLEVASQSGGLGSTATAEFSVGCVNQNHWINGSIPFVTQYNKTLSASEVQQNFNATRGRYGI
jgi:hypothetical protein